MPRNRLATLLNQLTMSTEAEAHFTARSEEGSFVRALPLGSLVHHVVSGGGWSAEADRHVTARSDHAVLLVAHGLLNRDRCAEGVSSNDEYRIVQNRPKQADSLGPANEWLRCNQLRIFRNSPERF